MSIRSRSNNRTKKDAKLLKATTSIEKNVMKRFTDKMVDDKIHQISNARYLSTQTKTLLPQQPFYNAKK